MADVVGNAKFTILAELDDAQFQKNIARGMERTRDEMGRFAKEYRTVGEEVMADMGNIFSTGTNAIATTLNREMQRAADQAGKGFTERITAAIGAVPSAIGTALSTGLISTASAALRSAGTAASEAFADRVRHAAPFWKSAFTSAFNQSVDPSVKEMISKTEGGVSKLAESFDRAGVHIASSLGTALGQAANLVVPKLMPAVEKAQELLQTGMQKAGDLASKALTAATSFMGNALSSGMEKAAKLAADATQKPFGSYLATGLKVALGAAAVAGGAYLVVKTTQLGIKAAKGLVDSIKSGLSALGTVIGNALKSAGSALLSAATSLGKGAAQALGDSLKLGVNMAGTAIAGILGTSFAKGFGRLKAIDQAEASLRGFAKTADHVPEIMDAATNAVTGTAFGLDQAATSAAQFAAANVPIQDMERHLSSLAKSAAGAGGDFDGMSDIFAKVAARGHVTGEVLNQLTSRGVSGLQALADHFGVTAEEAQAMVSSGEVSFDDFSRAMDAAMGDVAIEQATSFSGLMDNVGAAMGRMGAVAQKPFFDSFKAVLPGVMNMFDQFTEVIKPLADIIASRLEPAAESLGNKLKALDLSAPSAGADQLFGSLAALAPVLGGVAAAFAGPLLSSIPAIGPLFSGLTGPVGVLAGAMVALFAVKPDTLLAGFDSILSALPGILNSIVSKVTEVVPKLAENFASNAPILVQGFTEMFTQVAGAVASILPVLIPVAVEAVVTLADGIISALPALLAAGIELILALAQGIVDALPELISAIPEIIENFLDAFISNLPAILEGGIQLVLALVLGIVDAIPELIVAVVELIPIIVEALVDSLPLLIEGAVQLFLGIVLGLAQAIPELIGAIIALGPVLFDAVIDLVPALIDAGIQLIGGLIEGFTGDSEGFLETVQETIGAVVDWFSDTLLPAFEEFGEVLGQLFSSIGEAAQEFWDMLQPLFETIGEQFQSVWEGMQEAWEVIGPPLIENIGIAWAILSEIFSAVWDHVKIIFKGTWDVIKTIVETAINVVKGIIETTTALIRGDWQGVWNGIKSIFSAVWNGIKSVVTTVIATVKSVIENTINGIKAVWETVWNSVKNAFSRIWNGIVSAASGFANSVRSTFNSVVSFISSIPGRIIGFFSNMGSLLISSGRALIDGFKQGIMNAFESVKNAVSNGLSAVRNLFPFSPAKEGPFSGRGWVDRSGEALGLTFAKSTADALERGKSQIDDELSGIASGFNAFNPAHMQVMGTLMASALAAGLRAGESEVERAAKSLANVINSTLPGVGSGVSIAGSAASGGLTSFSGGSGDPVTRGLLSSGSASSVTNSSSDNSRSVVFEPGSIVVQGGADPKKTSLEIVNRIAEEANL